MDSSRTPQIVYATTHQPRTLPINIWHNRASTTQGLLPPKLMGHCLNECSMSSIPWKFKGSSEVHAGVGALPSLSHAHPHTHPPTHACICKHAQTHIYTHAHRHATCAATGISATRGQREVCGQGRDLREAHDAAAAAHT
eukprot:scaffold118491_cov18-Tisochrysis_lutea.AAC.1